MNINNWLTTHLPLTVYVVVECPQALRLDIKGQYENSVEYFHLPYLQNFELHIAEAL